MTRAVAVSSLLTSLLALPAFGAEKPRVAVLYFDINSTDPEHQVLKKGLCEMLITDLAGDPALTVVERTRLEEVIAELDLQRSPKVDPATAQRVGKLLGAQYLVMGSITVLQKVGGRVDGKVIAVETGKVAGSSGQAIKDGDVFDAESRLAQKLGQLLATADAHPSPLEKKQQGKLTLENAVKYSQALDAIDKKDKKAAKDKLQQVVKAQPDFMLASLELDRLMK
jgi:TolB-like protein